MRRFADLNAYQSLFIVGIFIRECLRGMVILLNLCVSRYTNILTYICITSHANTHAHVHIHTEVQEYTQRQKSVCFTVYLIIHTGKRKDEYILTMKNMILKAI